MTQWRDRILEFLPNAKIYIEDLKGDGDHYSTTIISIMTNS